jgi:uncharacterized protein (TIGR02145 family)
MRILRLNDILVDIDDKTAIGIDLQTYDIKDPAKRKISVSNSFTIPITNINLQAIGYIGGVQNTDNAIYEELSVDYWVNNTQFIVKAKGRIQGVKDRIELYAFEKPSIWDLLKQEKWGDFVDNYFAWLTIPKVGSEDLGTYSAFIDTYIASGGANGLFLPMYISNATDTDTNILLADQESGGHMCSFVKSVFEYIEDTYSVDFHTGDSFDFNIWDDAVASGMYFVYRDLALLRNATGNFFSLTTLADGQHKYENDFQADETRDKTLYDFVISFMQYYQIIKTENSDGDDIKLRRFDDLADAEVQDFSGNFEGKPKFIPFVDGFAQNSKIKFKNVEDGLSEETNQRILTCLNKNLDEDVDLFEINAFAPVFLDSSSLSELIPDLSTKDSFKNFKFFINGEQIPETIRVTTIELGSGFPFTDKTDMYAPVLYALTSEYNLFDDALDYPKYYEVTKWMNSLDILNFDFFKLYWIRELNGSFFMNKIVGFNPDKSRQATTLELLKVSSRSPSPTIVIPTAIYGRLYNWWAAIDANIAPGGMRVATNSDYQGLETYLITNGFNYDDTIIGNKIAKSIGLDSKWNLSAVVGAVGNIDFPAKRNVAGLSLIPGGIRGLDGSFLDLGSDMYMWTGTEFDASKGYWFYMATSSIASTSNISSDKNNGFSIRMVSDVNPGSTITDYEGRVYDVIQIGSQYWTVQNWASKYLNDGTPIPIVTNDAAWAALSTLACCSYDNDDNNIPI